MSLMHYLTLFICFKGSSTLLFTPVPDPIFLTIQASDDQLTIHRGPQV